MLRTPGLKPERKPFDGKHAELSEKIIGIFYQVHSELGFGFSEKVYANAFGIALRDAGMNVAEQVPIHVYYRGHRVGEYVADMIVNDVILLELKSAGSILEEHKAQLLNYLKATQIEVGFVMNFGRSASFARQVFDNERKGSLNWVRNRE